MVYKLAGLITGRGHIYLPRTPPVAHAQHLWRYINDILGYWGNNSKHHASAPYEAAEAYIQPASYHTDETVKSDLNRLMLLLYELQSPISGQAHIRHP